LLAWLLVAGLWRLAGELAVQVMRLVELPLVEWLARSEELPGLLESLRARRELLGFRPQRGALALTSESTPAVAHSNPGLRVRLEPRAWVGRALACPCLAPAEWACR